MCGGSEDSADVLRPRELNGQETLGRSQVAKKLEVVRPQCVTATRGVDQEIADQQDMISPKESTSVSHLERWYEVCETLLIFDWDDTLFPTSFVWKHPRLHWSEPCPEDIQAYSDRPDGPLMTELLSQHANTLAALLRLAVSLGEVVIVTMAEVGWVETSIRNFLPDIQGLIEELGIEVVYARSALPARFLRRQPEDEGHDFTKTLKSRAMERVIRKFYGTRRRSHGNNRASRSWKNVLSVGDSMGERLALQDLIFRHRQVDRRGVYKECRCKCLKLVDEPCLDSLTAEMQVLMSWLQAVVHHDGDIDLDFSELDEDSPLSPKNSMWKPAAPLAFFE